MNRILTTIVALLLAVSSEAQVSPNDLVALGMSPPLAERLGSPYDGSIKIPYDTPLLGTDSAGTGTNELLKTFVEPSENNEGVLLWNGVLRIWQNLLFDTHFQSKEGFVFTLQSSEGLDDDSFDLCAGRAVNNLYGPCAIFRGNNEIGGGGNIEFTLGNTGTAFMWIKGTNANAEVRVEDIDMEFQNVGDGIQFAEGSNARMGTATLSSGTATVSNTSVTATSRIFLTSQADGGTPGSLRVSARSAGTNFTITSSSGSDTSTVAYVIFEPSD